MNSVNITGRIVRDIEIKQAGQHQVVQNSIAVKRNFKNQEGKYDSDFFNFVAWRNQAEVLANFTKKGDTIGLSGRLQSRSYDNQQGQKVFVTEIVVESIDLLTPKEAENNSGFNANNYSHTNIQYNKPNTAGAGYGSQVNNYVPNSTPLEISEDQLPF